jgi:polysaccharide biosynthesis/export protein
MGTSLSSREEGVMTLGPTASAAAGGYRCARALHQCLRAAALLGILVFSSPQVAESSSESRAYKLAPGDRITVTVFGQPKLSGDLLVDEASNILLPLIGQLVVRDLTMVECQELIRDRLADGILNQPSVSVGIRELRPLYVLGDVRVPGAYPFRFGITVKSAVALAGGFGPVQLLQSAALAEFLLADERVHQLSFQRMALRVRLARLEAQRDGVNTFSPPSPSSTNEDANIAEVVAQFDSRAGAGNLSRGLRP